MNFRCGLDDFTEQQIYLEQPANIDSLIKKIFNVVFEQHGKLLSIFSGYFYIITLKKPDIKNRIGQLRPDEHCDDHQVESFFLNLDAFFQWHEEKHALKPWWEYSLGILIGAYKEFEKRVSVITKSRGTKTVIVEEAIKNLPKAFSISGIERLCPSVSRDMIRVVLNRLRKEGYLNCKGTGRGAIWEKRGNKLPKRGNKGGNKVF